MSHIELALEFADLRSITAVLDGPERRRPNRPETVSLALVALLRGPAPGETYAESPFAVGNVADEPFFDPNEAIPIDSYNSASVKLITTSLLLALPLWMICRSALHLL